MSNFHVALKKVVDDSYDVQIGCGLIDDMIQDIKEGLVGNKKKFAVITDSNVDEVYGRPVLEKILAAGYQGDLFVSNSSLNLATNSLSVSLLIGFIK